MDLVQTSVPGTDDWWLMELAVQWGKDLPRLARMKSYREGTNALPDEASARMREAYRKFIHMSRLNMAELIVTARTNRMKPLGFRTAAPGDTNGDAAAWSTWKRSSMKVGFRDFSGDAGDYGTAFTLVSAPSTPSPLSLPIIHHLNGWTMAAQANAVTPWIVEMAVMTGYDPILGVDILTLFGPGWMRQAFRAAPVTTFPNEISMPVSNGSPWRPGRGWQWASDRVPLGFTEQNAVNWMRGRGGKGMYEGHLDALDRITNTIRDRLTINAMQAFRQRAIQGELAEFYPDSHPKAGQKIDYEKLFKAGPAEIWNLPDSVEIWESQPVDTTQILNGTKDDLRHVAATTSTALYILSPDVANGSAEGASLARESLVFSTEEWIDRADVTIAATHSLAFQAQGDAVRAETGEISTIWAPVDRSSIIERSAASQAAKLGGLSQQMINERIFQLTPEELSQEQQNKSDEAFSTPVAS